MSRGEFGGDSVRTNIYLHKAQIEWLDEFVHEYGYSNRSEVIRLMIDKVIKELDGDVGDERMGMEY